MALLAARTIDRYARRRLYPDGTPRPQLRHARAMFPPAPLRLYSVLVVTLLELLASPPWVGRTETGVAVLAERVLSGPGRRSRWRLLAVAALADVVLVVTIVAATAAGQLLGLGGLLGASVATVIVLLSGWTLVPAVIEGILMAPLRRKQAEVVAETPGPVHLATGLVTSAPHVGAALVHALAARADAAGVAVVARTEAGPLVPFYEKKGDFTVISERRLWWGTAVFMVRAPQPAAAPAAT